MELTKSQVHDLAMRIRRDIAVEDREETIALLQALGMQPAPALLCHLVCGYAEAVWQHVKEHMHLEMHKQEVGL